MASAPLSRTRCTSLGFSSAIDPNPRLRGMRYPPMRTRFTLFTRRPTLSTRVRTCRELHCPTIIRIRLDGPSSSRPTATGCTNTVPSSSTLAPSETFLMCAFVGFGSTLTVYSRVSPVVGDRTLAAHCPSLVTRRRPLALTSRFPASCRRGSFCPGWCCFQSRIQLSKRSRAPYFSSSLASGTALAQVYPLGLLTAKYSSFAGAVRTGFPSTTTSSLDLTRVCGVVTTSPLTDTRPSNISSSLPRREAMPASARTLPSLTASWGALLCLPS
mmetsp:Transcript_19665/g.54618  ORF Transcript_19665/g.54618 Transcript_19665/m.54618 type:complete len:271 (-) Transcript_19665:19-831(-)